MKYLEKLALGLGTVSAIVNAYVLVVRAMGASPVVPAITWGLHFGVFICFAPALYQRTMRSRSELESEGFFERVREGGKMMWDGISKWPFYLLWGYGMLCFFVEWGPSNAEPWLFFSAIWMAFYYVSWAILNDENQRRTAA